MPGTNDLSYNSAEDSDNDTLNVVINKITGPETFRIPYRETIEHSPHYGNGDPNLGSRPDMGVDDVLF